MSDPHARYQQTVEQLVLEQLQTCKVAPVLFVGAGFSRRYINAPTWKGLLTQLCDRCPDLDKDITYYIQKAHNNLYRCAQELADVYFEWAWDRGQSQFDPDLFAKSNDRTIYIKTMTARIIADLNLMAPYGNARLEQELQVLQTIDPYAIITTNYDTLLEQLFPDYKPVIGQEVIRYRDTIGEIFKIHGCATQPDSMVLTEEDNRGFTQRQKYLSAKLLIHLAEHPVLFIGYGATDPNILAILGDLDEILAGNGRLIPNLFFLTWNTNYSAACPHLTDEVISLAGGRSVRVRRIEADDFSWVYAAFAAGHPETRTSVQNFRYVLDRVYQLTRTEAPTNKVDFSFEMLWDALRPNADRKTIVGFAPLDGGPHLNAMYPYLISDMAEALELPHHTAANAMIAAIDQRSGTRIKESDNCYHISRRSKASTRRKKGTPSKPAENHYYSELMLDLLRREKAGASPYADRGAMRSNPPDQPERAPETPTKSLEVRPATRTEGTLIGGGGGPQKRVLR